MSIWLIALKAVTGGIAVVGFSLLGQAGRPKRFSGLFAAAPSVALASLAMTVIAKGAGGAVPHALALIEKKEGTGKAWADGNGGVLGALGLAAFALTTMLLLHWNPFAALLLALLAWAAVTGSLYFLFRESGLLLRQDRLLSKSSKEADRS